MKRLNFCVVCNECYTIHVCIAWMFVERIYGSTLLCYVHSIDDFFYLWFGHRISIATVEAGAITSILFSSWAGADHEILLVCCNLLSPLLSPTPPPSNVCWAHWQSQMGSAAELHWHLAVIIIIMMIEREGGRASLLFQV